MSWVGEMVVIVVAAVLIAALLRAFVAQMFVIPSGSMENTIQIDDRVVVSKFGGFQRGDIVVFEDPGDWLPSTEKPGGDLHRALEFIGVLPDSGVDYLIKRVIGMPGDHVRVAPDGRIEVNGVELDETSYLYSSDGVQVAPSTMQFDIVVPRDRVFVMGDHRDNSRDSRCRLANGDSTGGDSAFVPVGKVVGAGVAIVSPLERMQTFTVPSTYSTVPNPVAPAPQVAVLTQVPPLC